MNGKGHSGTYYAQLESCSVRIVKTFPLFRRETSGDGSSGVLSAPAPAFFGSAEVTPPASVEEAAEEANRALNSRAVFLAFVRAAHGKVRPSVRWKTGGSGRNYLKHSGLERPPTTFEKRAFRREMSKRIALANSAIAEMGLLLCMKGWHRNLENHRSETIRTLTEWRGKYFLSCLELLKHLDRLTFRAYLLRRVRPVRTPSRAPRPVHTYPIPPSAPLAPPA